MFSRSASFVKTTGEWAARAKRRSVESAAKAHMVAVVMLGNDDAIVYLYDVTNDRVAKQIHRNVEWAA